MIQLAACLSRHLPHLRESRADGELLAAFLAERDEDAFAELARRHGPLVWAACRRLLPDAADAEDAFQTSFLVLVRRARRLRGRDTIGPWLYQVAVWTARNIRRRNARILAKRKPLGDSAASPASADLRTDIDAALATLPEKYRTPLVLCHLQGWSRARRRGAARLPGRHVVVASRPRPGSASHQALGFRPGQGSHRGGPRGSDVACQFHREGGRRICTRIQTGISRPS